MDKSKFVYVSYIAASPGAVWNALLDPKMTTKYRQHENVSDWHEGSRWEHRATDRSDRVDMAGKVMENSPPRRLVLTWALPEDASPENNHSLVTFEIEPYADCARIIITHDNLEPGSEMLRGISEGWPKVISSLKSLLEMGSPLPKLW